MIPGALLLDAVIAAVTGAQCDAAMVIRSAKFLRIVRPGEDVDLRWRNLADGGVKFECLAAEAPATALKNSLSPRPKFRPSANSYFWLP